MSVTGSQGSEHPPALESVLALARALDEQGVAYCHWKSTHGIPVAMSGATDLDLLVARLDVAAFQGIVGELGFKRVVSQPSRQFPAMEDYLGFDPPTGRLVHLHVHYQMVLGAQFVKNHRLPLEGAFLAHTDAVGPMKIPRPELELAVLVVRTLLKYRARDFIRDALSLGRESAVPTAIVDEYRHLLSRTDLDSVAEVLATAAPFLPGDVVMAMLTRIPEQPRSAVFLFRMRYRMRRALRSYRRDSTARVAVRYARFALRRFPGSRRIFPTKRKRLATGGLGIAVVGPDGAGKSTIVGELREWLSWRLDADVVYMGSADRSAVYLAVRLAALGAAALHRVLRSAGGEGRLPARWAYALRTRLGMLMHVAAARGRWGRFAGARRRIARGRVVIFDRYPTPAIRIDGRYFDGPRVPSVAGREPDGLARRLARWEQAFFDRIPPPEHLLLLRVRPEVAIERKPEHPPEEIRRKCRALESIDRSGLRLIDIDANRPCEQVLLEAKAAVWRLL